MSFYSAQILFFTSRFGQIFNGSLKKKIPIPYDLTSDEFLALKKNMALRTEIEILFDDIWTYSKGISWFFRFCFSFDGLLRFNTVDFQPVLPNFTGFYLVFMGFTDFTGFYWVFTECYLVILGFTGCYLLLLGFSVFTGFYWVLLVFIAFYCVLPSFTGFCWVLPNYSGFYWVLSPLTGFYWIWPSFTGFCHLLRGFTDIYWVY